MAKQGNRRLAPWDELSEGDDDFDAALSRKPHPSSTHFSKHREYNSRRLGRYLGRGREQRDADP